jgi:hypothetical protein
VITRVLPELAAFVEEQRDLEFLTPVKPTLLDDAAFRDRLGLDDISDADHAEFERMEQVMKALGMLSPSSDLLRDTKRSLEQGVLGLYRPDTKELLVRGTAMTAYARTVLVHELTHALDDQHFDLDRPEIGGDLEEGDAFRALIEGDAVRVQRAYIAALSPADRASVLRDDAAAVAAVDVEPQPADYFGAFPYANGPLFVEALAKSGGEDAVDAAFSSPPKTTAEILVPERYLLGLSGVRLSAPAIDGTAFDSGMIGALGLYVILQTAVSPNEAALAAGSWEGDMYLAWHDGDRTCVRARFVLDTPWTAAFTAKLLDRWAARQIDATMEAPGTVVITSCR